MIMTTQAADSGRGAGGSQNTAVDREILKQLRPVVDGFSYWTLPRPLPQRYETLALSQLDVLRRAAGYRARWYAAPDWGQVIPAFDHFFTQFRMIPGSYVYGFASALDDGVYMSISDSCSEIKYFSDLVGPGFINTISGSINIQLFSEPRPVLAPGHVDIDLANVTDEDITGQVVLLVAEPPEPIYEPFPNYEQIGRGQGGGC